VDLNIRQLRYFVVVVEEGHFARAAARLYVTPSALTQQIQRLERDVGFSLLDRAARPVVPTSAGEVFLLEARSMLEVAARASVVAQSLARRVGNRFALGFYTTPLGRYTRSVVDAFTREAGADSLKLVELALSEHTTAVCDGRVDASLAFGPVTEPRLRVEPAIVTPRMLVVAADHRLAGRPSVRAADASREPHAILSEEMVPEGYVRWWLGELRPLGASTIDRAPVFTIPEAMEEVASGHAVAIMPQLFADSHARADLVYIPVVDLPACEVLLCTRLDDDSPMTTLMRRVIADLAATNRPSTSD
jgi:DNA-binding transcriptional LysR family regulator